MSSFAATSVGGPFLATTSCILSRLSNPAAKTSPRFPVVRATSTAIIVLRIRTSRAGRAYRGPNIEAHVKAAASQK